MIEQLKTIRETFEAAQLKRECRRLPNGDYENSFVNSAWRYFRAGVDAANDMTKGQKPVAWLCIVNTADAGPTKFFTAPSDPRGFPVFAAPVAQQPQAEAVPPDVEVIRKALERAFIMGQNYWADADSESYSANKRSDVTRQKFNTMRDEVCAAIAQQKGQP